VPLRLDHLLLLLQLGNQLRAVVIFFHSNFGPGTDVIKKNSQTNLAKNRRF
jgi:hypothetical protein